LFILKQIRNTQQQQQRRDSWSAACATFEINIKSGPTYVCQCCGGLFFKKSCKHVTITSLENSGVSQEVITMAFSVDGNCTAGYVCVTCHGHLKKNKIPRLCLQNGLAFPPIPTQISNLTRLEERLIAGRHVFQTIWTVRGQHGQYRSKGGIVNVPVSLDTTVSSLPRNYNDSHVIHLCLTRRMEYVRNYANGNVRPAVVWTAAEFMMHTPLYSELSITLNENWMESRFGDENEGNFFFGFFTFN
jgi:hypothetical protein